MTVICFKENKNLKNESEELETNFCKVSKGFFLNSTNFMSLFNIYL